MKQFIYNPESCDNFQKEGGRLLRMNNVLDNIMATQLAQYAVLYWDERFADYLGNVYNDTIKSMEPFLLGMYKTLDAFGYKVPEPMVCGAESYKVAHILLLNNRTKDILISLSEDNLFFQNKKGESVIPLNDLCLFRNSGEIFLGTISHEQTAFFYLDDEEISKLNFCEKLRETNFYYPGITLPVNEMALPAVDFYA